MHGKYNSEDIGMQDAKSKSSVRANKVAKNRTRRASGEGAKTGIEAAWIDPYEIESFQIYV